jgi:hypothetical protein
MALIYGVKDYKSSMLAEFSHFHPDVLELFRYVALSIYTQLATISLSDTSHRGAEDVKCWPLFAHEPLDTWIHGKVVLIGDAAHPVRLQYLAIPFHPPSNVQFGEVKKRKKRGGM